MQRDLKLKIARLISLLFVPPSFTILTFIFFAFYYEDNHSKIIETISIALVFGFILPISLFLFLQSKKKIVDQDATIKEERTLPYLISAVFYLIGLILMIIFKLNIVIIAFWFCYLSNTLITISINKFWKISAHSIGVSGTMAGILPAIGNYAFFLMPLVFFIGWSRITLKCHTLLQVVAGIIFAFLSTFIQMTVIINYFNHN